MPSYNLVDEKWVPCIINGERYEAGLYDVLERAHEISEVYHPSPLVTLAVHRLLLAILHRNFGPRNLDQWKELWAMGKWDERVLGEYFDKWRHRFDLFDKQRPFYQVPEMEDVGKSPVTRLAQEMSSGNNATLFDHSCDSLPQAMPASVAARYLVAFQAFAIGFGRSRPFYFSDAPLTRGIIVFMLGNNLFETLLLNMVPYNEHEPFPVCGMDLPTWELDQLPQPDKDGSPIRGYLDYLTWQSRAVHLFPEADGASVRYCQVRQNLKLPEALYFDPMKCYRKDKKRGWVPLSLSQERAVWRDSHTLLQATSGEIKRPGAIDFLAGIETSGDGRRVRASEAYRLSVTGIASEPGKSAAVVMWRHERLPLPVKYLRDEDLVAALKRAIELAESVERVLQEATWALSRLLIAPAETQMFQKQDVENLSNHLSVTRLYWARLGTIFPRLVTRLPKDITSDGDQVRYGDSTTRWWLDEVKQAALSSFRVLTDTFDRPARALKAVTIAENKLEAELNRVLKSASDSKAG